MTVSWNILRMNSDTIKLNAEYASTLGAYWMIYAIAGSFASVFMLAKGYSNVHIGMVLAAANLLSMSMQPFIADRMDRTKGIRIIDASVCVVLLMMLAGAGFFVFSGGSFMLAAVLAIILTGHLSIQPLLNSLAFRLSESGTGVNYGIGRAGGSLGYSAILVVLGTLVEKKGEMAVPVCVEAACALLIILLLLTKGTFIRLRSRPEAAACEHTDGSASAAADMERIDLRAFIRRNRYFFILNLGIAGTLFSNSVLSNYMAQIAGNVNGTTEQVGRILSLMAFLEIPTMVFFGNIKKHFTSSTLIKAASLGLTAKIAACWLAGSVRLLFAAQFLQFFAFALIMPAMVYFIDEIMSAGEAVKGQALFTMMISLSGIAASFAGGWIIDVYGIKTLAGIATFITAAGAAVVFLSIDKVKRC